MLGPSLLANSYSPTYHGPTSRHCYSYSLIANGGTKLGHHGLHFYGPFSFETTTLWYPLPNKNHLQCPLLANKGDNPL
jgi:hypothetical protein